MIWNRKKQFLMSPLNSNKLSFFSNNSEQVKPILQYVHNQSSQMFSFFLFLFNLCTVYFPKNVRFFPFFMLCSSVFKFLFFFFSSLSFSIVLSSFFCLFLIINCSFTIFFLKNLISDSLCLYLNIITIGSCLPVYSISNKYFHKTSMVH